MTATAEPDVVRELEHTHVHLEKLALDIGRLVRDETAESNVDELTGSSKCFGASSSNTLRTKKRVSSRSFAPPFPQRSRPSIDWKPGTTRFVERFVRLTHLAGRNPDRSALRAAYERFEEGYALHSRQEADLLEELGKLLTKGQQGELAKLLRALL